MTLGRWRQIAWLSAVAIAAYAVMLLVSGQGSAAVAADDVGQTLAAVAAVAACLVRARRARRKGRTALLGFAIAAGSWAAGQAYWTYLEVFAHTATPFPSLGDVGYLLYPVFTVAGLLLLPGNATTGSRARMLLDAGTVAASLFIVCWAAFLENAWRAATVARFALVVAFAYPVTDVVLLTFVVLILASAPRGKRKAAWLLFSALLAMSTADSTFAYLVAHGRYSTGGVIDLGWFAAFVLMGLAALVPTSKIGIEDTSMPSGFVLTAPYAAMLVAIAVGVTQMGTSGRFPVVEAATTAVIGLTVVARQVIMITENRRLMRTVATREDQLRHLALHDPVTGLANRLLFIDRLEHALALQQREPKRLAVVFLDLDDFKEVNDTLGHPAGDELLNLVGARLTRVLRAGDTVARFGGDEFAVLLEDRLTDPIVPARRMLSALSAPFTVEGRTLSVGASIGVVVVSGQEQPSRTSTTLLRDADIAMYAAKRSGKGGIETFSPEMEHPTSDDLDLRIALTKAMERDEVSVVFQPIVDARTGEVIELEALARWTHPELGPIGPDRFVPLAERFHLVNALTDRVLDVVCDHLAEWGADGLRLRAAVNVTANQLADPSLPGRLATALDRYDVDGDQLTVEITETALMHDVETAAAALDRIKALGIRVAVDDFGTGYSSLARLRHFPVDVLKIDRFFVRDLADVQSRELVSAMIHLAHSLGLSTVAEGVEDAAERRTLVELGCDAVQGWLVSRPVNADAVPAIIGRVQSVQAPMSSATR